MATLRSFVSEDSFPYLLMILRKIHCGEIKDFSVVVISGGPSSGKTTLLMVMRALKFGDFISLNSILSLNGSAPSAGFNAFRGIVTYAEFELSRESDLPKLLELYHKHINLGLIYRPLFSNHVGINKPATLIVTTTTPYKIRGGRETYWAETTLPIELPSSAGGRVVSCVDTHEGKHARYPLYIHLPHTFRSTDIDVVVNSCIKEFYESYAKL